MTDAAQFALTHGAAILFAWMLAQQAGAPIPAAPVLIAVGSLASSRRLGLASSLTASFSACLVANGSWYQVGRQGLLEGHRFGRANGEWQARAPKLMRGHSPASMLLAKFVAGSNFAPLLAGKAGVSATRFLTYESICSLTWSGTYIAVGYLSRSTALDAGADFPSALGRSHRSVFRKSVAPQIVGACCDSGSGNLVLLCAATCKSIQAALRVATAFVSSQLTNEGSRHGEWLRQ